MAIRHSYDPHVLATFMRVAAESNDRVDERETARKDLEVNLKKIRKLKFSKLSKDEIAEILGALEARIETALEKEGKITKTPEGELPTVSPNKELQQKIMLLERRLADFITLSEERRKKTQ